MHWLQGFEQAPRETFKVLPADLSLIAGGGRVVRGAFPG